MPETPRQNRVSKLYWFSYNQTSDLQSEELCLTPLSLVGDRAGDKEDRGHYSDAEDSSDFTESVTLLTSPDLNTPTIDEAPSVIEEDFESETNEEEYSASHPPQQPQMSNGKTFPKEICKVTLYYEIFPAVHFQQTFL